MRPLIKWPGGKSGEIKRFAHLIPPHERYIEPFFGGGALFFHLKPQHAIINDISTSLMGYYTLIKEQDTKLYDLLTYYALSFSQLLTLSSRYYPKILAIYQKSRVEAFNKTQVQDLLSLLTSELMGRMQDNFFEHLVLDTQDFKTHVDTMAADKIVRTIANNTKKAICEHDLRRNLTTGFASGYYMYFRKIYNDMHLARLAPPSIQYKVANFYFIREYCYGSMFRYNKKGEFNIPYGGMSYNAKDFIAKTDRMFRADVGALFKNTSIYSSDFEEFFRKIQPTERDFIFLDPPYDSDFSDYEGKAFSLRDQERLASALKNTPARFILVIKHTDFIAALYENSFKIRSFDNKYAYNVKSRNERSVEHLIVTNVEV